MPAIQRSEFSLALNQIATERGIDPEDILESIKTAILAAYRKDHLNLSDEVSDEDKQKEADEYTAEINSNTGETKIVHKGKDVTPPGFGRIATQTAKQVLLQKIREREKDAVMIEYTKRIGTVVNGMILRFAGPTIIVDIGKAEAIMPPNHKIQNENYYLNKKIAVYIVEIADDEKRGREIIVSRTHNGLLEGLFKREVPEVAAGSVVIKEIIREPGSRAKVAVYSDQSGIDPVGSCVGQKGVRIQAVIDAVDGLEKIDVIQWNSDPARFIQNALSPAKNLTIELNGKEKVATVKAPREELPLIIGKEGQNVRLASKLTGYNIEVEGIDAPVEVTDPSDAKAMEDKEVKE
jgi:N utilization substance protein A